MIGDKERQEALYHLFSDLVILQAPIPASLEEDVKAKKLFQDMQVLTFVSQAITDYLFMINNLVDPYDQKRRELTYKIASCILTA